MRKIITFLLFILIIGAGLSYISGVIMEMASDRAIDTIVRNVKSPGMEYTRPVFRSVNLSSLNAVTWVDVTFDVLMARKEKGKVQEKHSLQIGKVSMSLESLSERAVALNLRGLSILSGEKGAGTDPGTPGSGDYLEKGDLTVRMTLGEFSEAAVVRQMQHLIKEIHALATAGATGIPLSFSATKIFEIRGNPHRARLTAERAGEQYRLVMNREDVKIIAASLPDMTVTPMDVEVISRNPIRASQLMRIRDQAAATAKLAREQDPNVPEDAYRHVLWSYLLVSAYGEAFAKEVTDAHEFHADQDKLSKEEMLKRSIESYQDLHNNAAGRRYAQMGYPQSRILRYVMADDAVIRDENRAARFNAAEYERLKPVYAKPN